MGLVVAFIKNFRILLALMLLIMFFNFSDSLGSFIILTLT